MYRICAFRRVLASSSSHFTPAGGLDATATLLLLCNSERFVSTNAVVAEPPSQSKATIASSVSQRKDRISNISQSLQFYLESLKAHEKMIKYENAQFELGKRHLANIMGWPLDMKITQADIDRAIRYLFPSGLTDSKALPVMRPPEEILPRFKKMEFDSEGRPLDTLFYTMSPKFYKLLSEINRNTLRLIKFHDERLLNQSLSANETSDNDAEEALVLVGSEWLTKTALSVRLGGERISDDMYASCIMALEYLVSLPYSHFFTSFIMDLRQQLTGSTTDVLKREIFGCTVPSVQINPQTGQRYAEENGRVKRLICRVTVSEPGTGKYTVDGHHYGEFRLLAAREVLLSPLIVTGLLGKVDISAIITQNPINNKGGGNVLIPRAVRHGAALCLAALFPEHRETLRLAGLLTLDVRKKERSKINQPGARAKWIWKKR